MADKRPGMGSLIEKGDEMFRTSKPEQAQKTVLGVTDNVPEEAWYWAAIGSIGLSAILKVSGKDNLAIFVGQWPPTFLLFGLYYRLTNIGTK